MTALGRFLTRRQHDGSGKGRARRWSVADVLTYGYLIAGVLIMFGPVAWLVLSSFKTQANLLEFPPTLLPLAQVTAVVEGYPEPLPLFDVVRDDGSTARLAQVRRIGLVAQMVDPAAPQEVLQVPIDRRTAVRSLRLATENYTESFARFNFGTYLRNSVIVTIGATLITLIINSMAAFALSKYRFRGRNAIFLVIIATLMIPISVILVPVYLVITEVGWINNLWGVIIPGAATPTGVFLLRQYMLTIPDELLDSGRIDGSSEWRIFWQIVLPLSAPALAVLAIFSVMWRWNDFLWPLIILTAQSNYTLPVALAALSREHVQDIELMMAGAVVTVAPVLILFLALQRYYIRGMLAGSVKG